MELLWVGTEGALDVLVGTEVVVGMLVWVGTEGVLDVLVGTEVVVGMLVGLVLKVHWTCWLVLQ
jgi:hypothetical protein